MGSEQLGMLTLGDYWTILMRRKWPFVAVFGMVIAGAVALAMLLPPTYRSEATIMIERQAIPENLVATTVNSYVQEQIQQTRQKLAAHKNMLEIAEKYDLYPEMRAKDPAGTAALLHDSIEIEMEEVQATDPNRTGERRATIAFRVAFYYRDAEVTQAVTNELAERYLQEHKAVREAQAAEVAAFLDAEAGILRDEISVLEAQMAEFKQAQLRQLPELMDMNLRLFERTENEIAATEVQIREELDRIDAITAELSLTPAYSDVETESGELLLSAEKQLSALTAQYLRASSRYSAKHPDVIRLAREIRILADQVGQGARADELLNELAILQENLRDLRRQYSTDHPDIRATEQSIAAIQRGIQTAVLGNGAQTTGVELPPDNPRYVTLKTQLDAANSNLVAARAKLANLQTKLVEFEERLFSTPDVERDFRALSLDYQNATSKYQEIKDKQLQARLAQQLESGTNAEKFTLLSGAFLPSFPDSPNRIGIVLLGALLALAAGLGTVAASEYLDNTIRGARSLQIALGLPPLATIPNGARSNVPRRQLI